MEKDLFKLEMEGISPLFIGSGELYSQLDYITEDEKLHIIGFDSLLKGIPLELIDDLTNDISQNFKNNRWEGNIIQFMDDYKLDWRSHVDKTHELIGDIGKNELHQFIKTSDRIYIPGSSVKGAIRTCILHSILVKNPDISKMVEEDVERLFDRRNVGQQTVHQLLSTSAKDDLLRALIISDMHLTIPNEPVKIVESNVYHLKDKEWTIPIFYEVLDRGFIATGTIKIVKELLNGNHLKDQYFKLDPSSLVEAINTFSRAIIDHELNVFRTQKDANLSGLIAFYEQLSAQIKSLNENECILRLGQGSSILAVTVFLQFRDNKQIMQKYKKLEIITFNAPDGKDRQFAIAKKGDKTFFVARNSQFKPRLNETWLCNVRSKGRNIEVKLLERVDPSQRYILQDMLFPVTRKLLMDNNKEFRWPFGWTKLKLVQ